MDPTLSMTDRLATARQRSDVTVLVTDLRCSGKTFRNVEGAGEGAEA
jgi:hypothetical protein